MPEAPDLEVVKDFLNEHAAGRTVAEAHVLKPSVVRPLDGDLTSGLRERRLDAFERRGKFLLVRVSGGHILAINPMLTGALQYCESSQTMWKRTCLLLRLGDGRDLRYIDDKQMGMVYWVRAERLDQVSRLNEQGPDVLNEITLEEFQKRLRPFHGEIKGILTRGRFISGIGNAYADEVLFAAEVYPFKRRKALTEDEVRRLHESSREVVLEAIATLRRRMGDKLHVKIRDFLKVHNKGGTPCPRCGGTISQLTANRRITSYCRRCQPGMLIRN